MLSTILPYLGQCDQSKVAHGVVKRTSTGAHSEREHYIFPGNREAHLLTLACM